ncbi:GNAT family N-acetyltransferase [Streptomyces sp. NPDC087901]|uniref:GNAT family N-acetyltransferase n=1 Tax=Streptomyces sp. NPDC087901 TaxID=3365818 RepID=UPI0038296800
MLVQEFADGVRRVYAEAFSMPPWNEGEAQAAQYVERLAHDVARPGFTAALAVEGDHVLGFATGWTTGAAFPSVRCYPQVSAALGADLTAAWLCGGREVDELAVAGAAQGRGIGAALLDAVTADAPDGRCWLLTSVRAEPTLSFYRRLGWTQATHPAPGGAGHAAFLGPRHPARTTASLAL